jgi:hypothetical protein
MFLGNRARPVRMADNLTIICEPVFYTMWDPQHLTTLLAPWPVTEIALLLLYILPFIFLIETVEFD